MDSVSSGPFCSSTSISDFGRGSSCIHWSTGGYNVKSIVCVLLFILKKWGVGKTSGGQCWHDLGRAAQRPQTQIRLYLAHSYCPWDNILRETNRREEVTPLCEAVSANAGTLIHLESKLSDKSCISSLSGRLCYPAISAKLNEHKGSCRIESRAQHKRMLRVSRSH